MQEAGTDTASDISGKRSRRQEECGMEQITGPFNGFYIATYAGESSGPTPSFFAYAKICRGKPENYWDAHCCAKVPAQQLHPTAQRAIAEAEKLARKHTGELAGFAFAPSPRYEHFS
jgi:hypothetical protein